ncbi:unnamed protein product [Spirodela intermedia]|uniref:Uncharacterized protein n=1 Tax=Spirodela intermedia TaxID=51605 RepID=A0A7I8JVX9_SPIIN|nr:unnamed protein product [Spirodela intermedia]
MDSGVTEALSMRKEELVVHFAVKITKIVLELQSLGESISKKEPKKKDEKANIANTKEKSESALLMAFFEELKAILI